MQSDLLGVSLLCICEVNEPHHFRSLSTDRTRQQHMDSAQSYTHPPNQHVHKHMDGRQTDKAVLFNNFVIMWDSSVVQFLGMLIITEGHELLFTTYLIDPH